ncbi:MAG: hypothetical protein HOE34_06545 [Pelagibacterales bacterium]|nr:hypothetical protein [Pelagibacterales bacterium]
MFNNHKYSNVIYLFGIASVLFLSYYIYVHKNKAIEPSLPNIIKTKFSDLPEWDKKEIFSSLKSFEHSCKFLLKKNNLKEENLLGFKIKTKAYIKFCEKLPTVKTNNSLKKLIEASFYPVFIESREVLFTGYLELEVKGSQKYSRKEAPYAVPIFKKPPNLVSVNLGKFKKELKNQTISGIIIDNNLVPVPSRKIIENEQMFKEHILAYIDDPALAYFMHIQGSGIIKLATGEELSIGYAGDNGKEYFSIGKKLIEDEIIKKEDMSMQAIINWMQNNKKAATNLMQLNDIFIFFKERINSNGPQGSSGSFVTPMHSVAVDNQFFPYHLPFWFEVENYYSDDIYKKYFNIFIAQDTGSAIKGPTRFDLFLGRGSKAEKIAGKLSSEGKIWALLPK